MDFISTPVCSCFSFQLKYCFYLQIISNRYNISVCFDRGKATVSELISELKAYERREGLCPLSHQEIVCNMSVFKLYFLAFQQMRYNMLISDIYCKGAGGRILLPLDRA